MEVNTISINQLAKNTEGQDTGKQVQVDFLVKYKDDYKGPKHMQEGLIKGMALDTAEHFEKMGMGTIQGTHEPAVEKVLTEPAEPFKENRSTKVVVDEKQTATIRTSLPEADKTKNQK